MNEENKNLPEPNAPKTIPPPVTAPVETTAAASVPPTEPIVVVALPPAPMPVPHEIVDTEADQRIRQISRRSFVWAGVTLLGSYAGLRWINSRRTDSDIPWPFRRALEVNEQISRDYFQTAGLAPTFPRAAAREPKANGDEGMSDELNPEEWELSVEGLHGADGPQTFSLEDIKKLPRVEIVTELKCIEGWSQVVAWAGARLADFVAKHPPTTKNGGDPDVKKHPENLVDYVYMETPDSVYYVGLDMASALHPQTLLCYEMNGKPLTDAHGAPVRLVIPVKYGIKNIKRIGLIRFTNERPKDYWAEQGYDWWAGH